MAENSLIAWTDNTFNAWMGCVKVSPGCAHCYAETLTRNRMGLHLWGKDAPRQVTKAPWANIRQWYRQAKERGEPLKVFCGSLMDWAEDHPTANATRDRLWGVIRDSHPWLIFQMLTKRTERIAECLPPDWGNGWPHVWLGTTVENQEWADRRLPYFDDLKAVVFFASYEPALGPIDFFKIVKGRRLIDRLDWGIYGGESGPGYRRHDLAWPRLARDQFAATPGKAFFYKQSPAPRTEMGIELDGEIIRQFPTPRVASFSPATLFPAER